MLKKIVLIVEVDNDFDKTDEIELDSALADTVEEMGYEIVESKPYENI